MNSNRKISTTIFIFSIMLLALIIFGVWPLVEGIVKDSSDLISTKNKISTFNVQVTKVEYFENNYENYRSNLEKINQLFIDPTDPVDFIKFLENTASEYKINMQMSLPPAPSSTEIVQDFIIFQLSLKGDFSDISSFINKIEFGPYLIEVEDLTIQNQENNQKEKNSKQILYKNSASLNIKVFTKNEI